MQRHRLCGVHTEKATLPGRLSFPLIIFFACTVTSTANLRSKILWRHVLGPRMLWIYYRGLVYNSGLTRANRVPLEVRVSTYVPECLSLFATRHDETTNRPKWHRPPCSANNVAPIPTYASLVSFPRPSFLVYPSSTSFFFLLFSLDYFYRIMLMRGAMVKHEFSKRESRSRNEFSVVPDANETLAFLLWMKKIVANILYVAVLFCLLVLWI